MHYQVTDMQADIELNRLIRYQITAKRNYLHRGQTDGRTARRIDVRTDFAYDNIRVFFRKKPTKIDLPTLEYRTLGQDLIQVCRILEGIDEINYKHFFS